MADYNTDDFISLAKTITNASIRSRDGYGAFRKYRELAERTARLVLESALFSPPDPSVVYPWALDPELLHFFFRRGRGYYNPVRFFRDLLVTPENYEPACIWALFWALAKGEQEFNTRYLPFWSHEERLTGHFVSQIIERTAEFAAPWEALSASDDPSKESHLKIWYADTATSRRESITGADLGIVIHGKYAENDEFLKVARFQAKKVSRSGTARIDLNQTKSLIDSDGLGYYLFYHAPDADEWRSPPSVCPASSFKWNIERQEEEGPSSRELGTESIGDLQGKSYDFAAFATFALADPAAEFGKIVKSPQDAVWALMGGNRLPTASRIMVVTMGSALPPVDWDHLFAEFIGNPNLVEE